MHLVTASNGTQSRNDRTCGKVFPKRWSIRPHSCETFSVVDVDSVSILFDCAITSDATQHSIRTQAFQLAFPSKAWRAFSYQAMTLVFRALPPASVPDRDPGSALARDGTANSTTLAATGPLYLSRVGRDGPVPKIVQHSLPGGTHRLHQCL
jgi:hypothetical protein